MWDSESSWLGSGCGCRESMGRHGGSDSSTVKEESLFICLKKKHSSSQSVCKCILTHLSMQIASDADELRWGQLCSQIHVKSLYSLHFKEVNYWTIRCNGIWRFGGLWFLVRTVFKGQILHGKHGQCGTMSKCWHLNVKFCSWSSRKDEDVLINLQRQHFSWNLTRNVWSEESAQTNLCISEATPWQCTQHSRVFGA